MAVLERVHLPIKEGTEEAFEEKMAAGGLDVLRKAPGCEGVELRRGIESPSTYLLLVHWDVVESHIAFTQDASFADLVDIFKEHLSGATDMAHFGEPL